MLLLLLFVCVAGSRRVKYETRLGTNGAQNSTLSIPNIALLKLSSFLVGLVRYSRQNSSNKVGGTISVCLSVSSKKVFLVFVQPGCSSFTEDERLRVRDIPTRNQCSNYGEFFSPRKRMNESINQLLLLIEALKERMIESINTISNQSIASSARSNVALSLICLLLTSSSYSSVIQQLLRLRHLFFQKVLLSCLSHALGDACVGSRTPIASTLLIVMVLLPQQFQVVVVMVSFFPYGRTPNTKQNL